MRLFKFVEGQKGGAKGGGGRGKTELVLGLRHKRTCVDFNTSSSFIKPSAHSTPGVKNSRRAGVTFHQFPSAAGNVLLVVSTRCMRHGSYLQWCQGHCPPLSTGYRLSGVSCISSTVTAVSSKNFAFSSHPLYI